MTNSQILPQSPGQGPKFGLQARSKPHRQSVAYCKCLNIEASKDNGQWLMGVSSMGSLRLYNGGGRHRIGGLSVCITLSILTTELSHHVRLFVCLFVCLYLCVCICVFAWRTMVNGYIKHWGDGLSVYNGGGNHRIGPLLALQNQTWLFLIWLLLIESTNCLSLSWNWKIIKNPETWISTVSVFNTKEKVVWASFHTTQV